MHASFGLLSFFACCTPPRAFLALVAEDLPEEVFVVVTFRRGRRMGSGPFGPYYQTTIFIGRGEGPWVRCKVVSLYNIKAIFLISRAEGADTKSLPRLPGSRDGGIRRSNTKTTAWLQGQGFTSRRVNYRKLACEFWVVNRQPRQPPAVNRLRPKPHILLCQAGAVGPKPYCVVP